MPRQKEDGDLIDHFFGRKKHMPVSGSRGGHDLGRQIVRGGACGNGRRAPPPSCR